MIAQLRSIKRRVQAHWEASRAFADDRVPPVFIYQMGKVGSSTVYHAVKKALPGVPVYHVHFLSEHLAEHRNTHERSGIRPVPYHIYLGEALREQLLKHPGMPVRIISLLRDPIAFELSNVFQNPRLVSGQKRLAEMATDPAGIKHTLEQRLATFGATSYVESWFDRELKMVFGIDVFAEPYAAARGWQRYRRDGAELLLIRLEDLTREGPTAIADFLGLSEPLAMSPENDRVRQSFGEEYARLGRQLKLDTAIVGRVYAGRFAQHFYTPAELQAFRARWQSP